MKVNPPNWFLASIVAVAFFALLIANQFRLTKHDDDQDVAKAVERLSDLVEQMVPNKKKYLWKITKLPKENCEYGMYLDSFGVWRGCFNHQYSVDHPNELVPVCEPKLFNAGGGCIVR